MKKLAISAMIIAALSMVGVIFIYATQNDSSDETHKKALTTDYRIYSPVLPDTLSFAGERVPLEIYYVHEGLDREVMVNMYWQSNMLLWIKRANRYFPIIEPILKANGVPDDFKYLCVIESGLLNVTSPAKASGYWQFLSSTGKSYGLEINSEIDMRNHIEQSTEAACKFLKELRSSLGSWTNAAAAYNCGAGGLRSRLNAQGVQSYYDVRLNTETTRYIYRILAAKLIMQHPQEYGFYVRQCDLYPPIPYRTAELKGQNVDLYQFAKDHNTTYKMLRELNPWLTTTKLTNKNNKTYTVKLPIENGTLRKTIQSDKQRSVKLVESI